MSGRGSRDGWSRRWRRSGVVVAVVVAAGLVGCQPSPSPSPTGTDPAPTASPTPTETTPAREPVTGVVDTVAVGAEPGNVTVAPDGTRAYVSNASDGTVSVIDTATSTVADTIDVGERPAGLAVHSGFLYVSDPGEAPYGPPPQPPAPVVGLVVVDLVAGAVDDRIEIGSIFAPVALDPVAGRAYVMREEAGGQSVTVVDLESREVGDSVSFPGEWSAGPVVAPELGRLYVTDSGTGVLYVVDLETLEVLSDDPVAEPDLVSVRPMAVDEAAGRLYLSEWEGPLHVVDTATTSVVAEVPMGEGVDATVSGVVLDPDAGVGYVLKSRAGEVDVVDLGSLAVVGTIDVGGQVSAGALDPQTGRLYLVDRNADVVHVLG
mgnify:CR=1 FL=1